MNHIAASVVGKSIFEAGEPEQIVGDENRPYSKAAPRKELK